MHLVAISVDSIRIGQPLPFPLMDKEGVLLAQRSFVIPTRHDLEVIAQRGGGLYIDVADSEAHHRAYVERLHGLVNQGKALGEIASVKVSRSVFGERSADYELPDWLDLQVQANTLLRDSPPAVFMDRLERLQAQLSVHANRNPDGTLFALIHLSATEVGMYSATHAMLVSMMCGLAAREVMKWPAAVESVLCKAALTMNLGMTELQDRLASQLAPVSAEQRKAIDEHSERSAKMLEAVGVKDAIWLDAVRAHHLQAPGPLATRTPAQRLARLIQRADMFAARLSPRASRQPTAPGVAMQACYFDENKQVDEAGAALIKTVGIHPPGTFVRLESDEIAMVIKRGANTTTPRVAVMINRSGMPTVEYAIRDTSQKEFRIVASVAHRDVKLRINLERMLPLTQIPNSERPW